MTKQLLFGTLLVYPFLNTQSDMQIYNSLSVNSVKHNSCLLTSAPDFSFVSVSVSYTHILHGMIYNTKLVN